jgi:Flp pilus assembly protein TadD
MAWSSGRGKPLAFMLVKPDGSVSPMQMPFIMEQSWSPDGHKCYFDEGSAFGGTINLYESNPDGSDKRQLTSDGQCSRPQCSPDGRQLAFNMSTIKKSFVGIMNVDGTGARTIAEGSSPCWSPDGKQLAFQTGSQETMAVAVANADGSDMRKILRQSRLNKVAWMPDGKKIVYTFEKQAGDKTINQFGVVAVDGTGSRLLSKPDENCDAVVVAPVGDAIAFVTTSIDNTYRGAWMITDSSGQRRPLTDPIDTDGGWYASWSLPMTPAVAAAWMEGAGQTGPRTAGTATEGVKVSKDDFGSGSIKSFTEAEEAFKRGMAFVPAGQWAKAEPKFREAVRIDPAKGEYQLWLGNACANLQKWDDAERAYRECIRLTPANPQGHSGLAWALAARGQWPQSTAAYQEAIRLDPQNAIFHYYLGITYNWQKKWAEAASAYQEAVRLNPTNSTFHFALGQTYDWQGKWDEAQSAYEEAIKLEPMNAVMRDALGSAYYNQKKLAEAEAQYREAIRLSPTYGGFHANLAGVLFNQNRRDEALVAAKEALRLGFRQHWVYGQLGINP